jgi:succinate dehydrogenase/fumarate reductase cytochrome b subunit
MTTNDRNNQNPGFFHVIGSVLAAFIGVQSEKNRERDFKRGKPWHYIVTGIVLTIVFILIVWSIVRLVLSSAGV